MKEYAVVLMKDKRIGSFKLLAWFIVVIDILTLVYISYTMNSLGQLNWVLVSLAVLLVFTIGYRVTKKTEWLGAYQLLPLFALLVAGWCLLGFYWVALANLLIFLLSLLAQRRHRIVFSQTGIQLPSFPARMVAWTELSNALLKDGILTVDFRNNKLLQQYIDEQNSSVNEEEFNEFCKVQLAK